MAWTPGNDSGLRDGGSACAECLLPPEPPSHCRGLHTITTCAMCFRQSLRPPCASFALVTRTFPQPGTCRRTSLGRVVELLFTPKGSLRRLIQIPNTTQLLPSLSYSSLEIGYLLQIYSKVTLPPSSPSNPSPLISTLDSPMGEWKAITPLRSSLSETPSPSISSPSPPPPPNAPFLLSYDQPTLLYLPVKDPPSDRSPPPRLLLRPIPIFSRVGISSVATAGGPVKDPGCERA